jgi:hypothetical protein
LNLFFECSPRVVAARSNPGLKLANAFGVIQIVETHYPTVKREQAIAVINA